MKWIKATSLIATAAFAMCCQVKPEPVRYGEDACQFCSMTIVDRGYAAEYVTSKGKVYKFDAIECMYRSVKGHEGPELTYILVTDRARPGSWIPVDSAVFVIDPELPSPMGENLSAFRDLASARSVLEKENIANYRWDSIPLKR